jgi:predicted aldo/keto reductase-like oxidoreductase
MVTYNYRVMHIESVKKAVDKCRKAGLAIVAMKTQGTSTSPIWLYGNKTAMKLTDSFIQKGFTPAQATLKAVWTNQDITSLTSMMLNMNHFTANVAAALDKTKLSDSDMELLKEYAKETRSQYCAGCTRICQSTFDKEVPIGDVMRYLMYARAYGDRDRARALFNSLPEKTRTGIVSLDYSLAEKRCPQRIAIGEIMGKAATELG